MTPRGSIEQTLQEPRLRLGVDIGGSRVKVAWAVAGGPWTLRASGPYREAGIEGVRLAIAEALDGIVERERAAVGICAPGVVEPATGRVERADNMRFLEGARLGELLPLGLGRAPLRVLTDARAAAADACAGLAGRCAALVIGTGVGLAVLDDGAPLRVSGESSGHIGQADLHLPGEPGFGTTVESVLGARALQARLGSPLPALDLPEADPALRELVRVIRLVHAIYRPRHVRVLGGVGMALRPSLMRVRTMTAHQLTGLAREGWTLGGPTDAFHAARGAATLAGRVE
ncbi:MAG: ROK family protein [Phycisphaerales bacterium]|nr:ROK family protein [Phycisphaerales bacterium]